MGRIMNNLKLLWGIWFASLLITIIGIFLVEMNGGVENRTLVYLPIAFLFAMGYFGLLAYSQKLKQNRN